MRTPLIAVAVLGWLVSGLHAQARQRPNLTFLGGMFSPSDDEIQNIYGGAWTAHATVPVPLNPRTRLKLGGHVVHTHGDPFYRTDDFAAGEVATLRLAGGTLGLEANPFDPLRYPKLYFGAGVDYVFGRETIRGQPAATGQSVGAHLSAAAEFRLNAALLLAVQAQYGFLNLPFRSGRNRFKFNLSGAAVLAGLGFQLAN